MKKKNIKDLTIEELKDDLASLSEAGYRAGQIFSWVYRKKASDFKDMANLPCRLKEKLVKAYYLDSAKLVKACRSRDGTEKFLFELSDNNRVEGVLIHSGHRLTLCVSTQVGCKYSCSFCASGFKGFLRDLAPSEILDQVLFAQEYSGRKVTNFVFMGMGEPLDNFDNVSKAVRIMNCREGLDIGARRITISTCGVIPGIEKLARLGLQINLSISLHAAEDRLRSELMPVNKKYPLERLIRTCEKFVKENGRMLTFEYILIKGKNDSLQDAALLSSLAGKLKAKVNLIPVSPVCGKGFNAPLPKEMLLFKSKLVATGVNATLRNSRGSDIQAACGQLALVETASLSNPHCN